MTDVTLHQGDVLDVLPGLEAETFDACLCDPPYGLRFMGRAWDHGVPGEPVWREVLRVLKPGAFVFAFGGTRTFHRLAVGIEDAGAEIRDSILAACWVYGSGFPKSMDISKAIDAAAGAKRKTLATRLEHDITRPAGGGDERYMSSGGNRKTRTVAETIPATLEAENWNGWGSALKPAWEPVVVGMKPLDGTFAENALDHGVAGLNIDGCRIFGKVPKTTQGASSRIYGAGKGFAPDGNQESKPHVAGRYPSNLVLSHHPECRRAGKRKTNPDGTETVPVYDCHPVCPVAALDQASGELGAGNQPKVRAPATERQYSGGYAGQQHAPLTGRHADLALGGVRFGVVQERVEVGAFPLGLEVKPERKAYGSRLRLPLLRRRGAPSFRGGGSSSFAR